MLFLTRWFGVTGSDSERNLAREKTDIDEIVTRVLQMQASTAAKQHRPLVDWWTRTPRESAHGKFR